MVHMPVNRGSRSRGKPHLEVLGRTQEVSIQRGTLDAVHVEDEVHRRARGLGRGRLLVEEASSQVREAAGAHAAAGRLDLVVLV